MVSQIPGLPPRKRIALGDLEANDVLVTRALPVLTDAESRVAVYEDLPVRPDEWGRVGLPALRDAQGRTYTYLRLSVTDRCDFACVYCMPAGGEPEHSLRKEMLSFEEAARLVRVFASMGIRRVRFTGGEPLLRKDLVQLVELVHRTTPVEQLALTTNASRLTKLAGPLRDAGLSCVNVSLDSLAADRFAELSRGGDLVNVLAGIDAALDVGLEVKLNIVAIRGINDHEIPDLVDWAWSRGITPRFIELMPLGEGAKLGADARIPSDEVITRLGDRIDATVLPGGVDRGPATYRAAADGSGQRVGFITPLSHEFCGSCNRVRITARGDVRACLASRRALSLRDVMRESDDDLALAWAAWWSLAGKDDGHGFLDDAQSEHMNVGMSLIGG